MPESQPLPTAPNAPPRRSFTEEFKREAVRLAQERGNLSAVARDLGIHDSVLQRWKKRLEEGEQRPFPGQGNPRDEAMATLQRERPAQRGERAPKKGSGYLHQPPPVRYHFIQSLVGRFAVRVLCRVLGVSTSGYYAWCRREPSPGQQQDKTITQRIRHHFEVSRQTYGSPRIQRELRAEGMVCGKHRVARLMHGAGLRALAPCRFQVTTDSKHALPVAENLLQQDFTASRADERWAADITYVWTGEGWLYLAVVLDLFSRRIVGWSMQANLHKGLVLDALTMALGQRRPAPGLLHHSDRGSQYASVDFQEALATAGIVCSMSRRGNCFDNAMVESFFGTLKVELVYRCRFATRQQARQEVFEYIEVWYNRSGRHSSLGYLSPAEFERRHRPGALSAPDPVMSLAA